MRRILVVGAVVAALGIGSVAAARPLDKGTFHDEFNFVEENFCDVEGLTVEIDGVVDGRFSVQTKGRDGLVYFAEHVRVAITYTNLESGAFVTETNRVLNKDLNVTDNGDGTLTVILLATGNATVYGPDGKAIARNPGQVRVEFLIDHSGTPGDPSDDDVLSEELIKGSTGRTDDFCEAVVPALT